MKRKRKESYKKALKKEGKSADKIANDVRKLVAKVKGIKNEHAKLATVGGFIELLLTDCIEYPYKRNGLLDEVKFNLQISNFIFQKLNEYPTGQIHIGNKVLNIGMIKMPFTQMSEEMIKKLPKEQQEKVRKIKADWKKSGDYIG